MPLIIPPGFAQAVYIFSWVNDPEPMVVTMGHDVSGYGGDGAQAAEDIAGILFASTLVVSMSDPVAFVGVDLYVGNDGGPPSVYEYALPDPQEGTADGASLPPNSAYLVKKATGAAGRRARGRLYLPGVGEDEVNNNGVVAPSFVTTLQGKLDDWFEGARDGVGSAGPAPMVLLHRSEGAGTEPPPTVITGLQLQSQIATQRRRLRP